MVFVPVNKVPSLESTRRNINPYLFQHCLGKPYNGFYDYYHILRTPIANDDDESEEFGSTGKGELKGYTEGLHSPFGIIGQIREKTGYTLDYILWAEPWVNFILDSADAPRFVKGNRPVEVIEDEKEIKNIFGNRIKIIE